ncbi:MAG: sulfotransferase [Candidatus Heimdallarchaeota archaeon]|nr:MAG: sulfotransferase [Candidatus Heimdallarchaeota archaeon]
MIKIKKTETKKLKEFDFPAPMYFIVKFFHTFSPLANIVHTVESYQLKKRMEKTIIDRPIYVTGLARAGTTITLEMLNKHPDVAAHRYLHMVLPYSPHWTQNIADYTPIMKSPVERLHKDRIAVTRDSPEAVEEIFWQRFFKNTHDETKSNILDTTTQNPQFERFYSDHLKKLLINRNASRYIAKNNYNVARMEYLQKLFPDVKFIIIIRNPFDHIASLAKQDGILKELEHNDPRLLDWTKLIGHREFGTAKVCINFNNPKIVQKIRAFWKRKETYIEGWAVYWAEAYSYIHKTLQRNTNLAKASLMVRYEDLCEESEATINKIIDHIEVDPKKFRKIKKYYSKRLTKPTYYISKFSTKEQEKIIQITGEIAEKYGYVF